jgi:periplasmic copper chaperone A
MHMVSRSRAFLAGLCLVLGGVAHAAPPVVSDGWARATVPGQNGGAAFFSIRSDHPVQIVAVTTPVAGTAQLHQMSMSGSTMTMRPVTALDIPARTQVQLSPSATHVMLFDLGRPLTVGQHFTLTLSLREPDGKINLLPVDIAVRALGQ